MKMNITATIWEGESAYISKCPELGVASCGKTPEDALKNLEEAAKLYLDYANDMGIMDDVEASLNSPHKFTSMIEIDRLDYRR